MLSQKCDVVMLYQQEGKKYSYIKDLVVAVNLNFQQLSLVIKVIQLNKNCDLNYSNNNNNRKKKRLFLQ